jgi:hypothetical protein
MNSIGENLARQRRNWLSAGHTNYHRRNVFHIDKGVEIFRASQMGKMDDVVSDFCDLASHFFSRSQVQLDSFAGAALQYAEDGRVRLQAGFLLGEQTGTSDRCNNYEKK